MLRKYIFAAIALLFFSTGVLADGKIGAVNVQKILSDTPQATRAKKKIEKDFEKREQDLQRIAKQLQGMQENIDKNAVTMAESDRHAKEREFADLSRDFQRKQREFREDLSQRQNEETAAIFERVQKAVKQIAEAEKYDIIIQEAAYINPRIDITDKVIKALGDGSK
jgi:outer membrane protein